jgi:hypothetical protein
MNQDDRTAIEVYKLRMTIVWIVRLAVAAFLIFALAKWGVPAIGHHNNTPSYLEQ